MLKPTVMFALALSLTPPAFANETSGGDLNPEEMTIKRVLRDVDRGHVNMMHCAVGYGITKKGDHEDARKVFEACAAAGYTGAMTWMSQLDNNGLGGDYDPDRAANWDRQAAEAGDPVGKFNYGLDLMRGHGVARDDAAGRALVDQAAADGLPVAKRLQSAGYDLDEVTPDADNWKYAPAF
ncbi:MAG: tetratricopeptide repeat protein [Paracoccaceae bacterium]